MLDVYVLQIIYYPKKDTLKKSKNGKYICKTDFFYDILWWNILFFSI